MIQDKFRMFSHSSVQDIYSDSIMSYTSKPFDGKYGEINDKMLGMKHALYEFNPGKFLYPCFYDKLAQRILDAPVREDDTWLISYPRTGSTWCQEMIWLIGNNLDFDTATSQLQHFRAPIIESSAILYEYKEVLKEKYTDSVEYVNSLPSPRFIKSHLSYRLLPSQLHKVKPKIIYTIRHPKDVCVSYFHFTEVVYGFTISFEEFCELFLNNALGCGGLFDHYFDFWNRRHEENMLVLRYEDMKRDTRGTIETIAKFMEKPLSENDLTALEDFLSFQQMRKNKGCNSESLLESRNGKDFIKKTGRHILRKGEIGDWKNHMSPEMSRRFDEWIKRNTEGTDLSFD